jgi:hypothetical protein
MPAMNMRAPSEIGIERFQANRARDKACPTPPLDAHERRFLSREALWFREPLGPFLAPGRE